MLTDGVNLLSGSSLSNVVVETGTLLPSTNLTEGRLFFLTQAYASYTVGFYAYDGSQWLTGDVTGVTAGTGLTGGGTGGEITLNLESSGVTLGSYGSSTEVATFTVDATGRLTAAANATIPSASTVQSGLVQLNDTTSSTSTTEAATANALKTAYDIANAALPVAGGTMTGDLTLANDPSSALHAATKQYVDNNITGLDMKESVRAATTANITLSGTQTVDGVSLVADDRVLVKDQTTASQNGIYVVAAGAWVRSTDADNTPGSEVTTGMYCFVEEGTVNADSGWSLITTGTITLDTTDLSFAQFTGLGQVTAGTGLTKSGSEISLDVSGVAAGTYNNSATANTPLVVDATGRITGTGSNVTITPDWANITSIPTEFTPSSHTHTTGELTDWPATVSMTEVGYLDGVTSSIQTQLGTKLDSSSYTASDVLTKLLTVDGASSLLDADLLDAQQGSYYLNYDNFTNVPSSFTPSYHTHTTSDLTDWPATISMTEVGYLDNVTSNIQAQINSKLDSSTYTASDVMTKIQTVDGTGSGLDADLLDGQQGSYYATADNWTLKTGNYTAVNGDAILADPSSAAFTITLPASPVDGEVVKLKTSENTSETNYISLEPGTNSIAGLTAGTNVEIDLSFVQMDIVYNTTKGWMI